MFRMWLRAYLFACSEDGLTVQATSSGATFWTKYMNTTIVVSEEWLALCCLCTGWRAIDK